MPPTDHVPLSFCRNCKPMFATSAAQLNVRRGLVNANPQVFAHACPHCGSTDWATSDAFIHPDPPSKWWEFWK